MDSIDSNIKFENPRLLYQLKLPYKIPQTGWLKRQKCIFSPFWSLGSPRLMGWLRYVFLVWLLQPRLCPLWQRELWGHFLCLGKRVPTLGDQTSPLMASFDVNNPTALSPNAAPSAVRASTSGLGESTVQSTATLLYLFL